MCFSALFSFGRWEMQGRAHKGFFSALHCWVAQAGRLSEILNLPPPGSSLAAPLSGDQAGGVQLLLVPATGAHCTGMKGFVLVGKLRREKGTGASPVPVARQQAECSPSNTAFCLLGCAAPRMVLDGGEFSF